MNDLPQNTSGEHRRVYLRKKPKKKRHINPPSQICEICDAKMNKLLYRIQSRGCTNCGKSGCRNCVKYSRTFKNGQEGSVCKLCKDLPKKEDVATEENDEVTQHEELQDPVVVEPMSEGEDVKEMEDEVIPLEEVPRKEVQFVPAEENSFVPTEVYDSKIDDLTNEISRLEHDAQEKRDLIDAAKHNEKLAFSRFKEISAENTKLKGELKNAKKLKRGNSFNDSEVLMRLDEIQIISEGRDQELIKVGKQMDDLVQQLQHTEQQKQHALEELQSVQASQIEQLEQLVGRLSVQKNRTLEIKDKLQTAVDERDYQKNIAKIKEREIEDLMMENEKLRELVDESESSSALSTESREVSAGTADMMVQTADMSSERLPGNIDSESQLPIRLVVDVKEEKPPKFVNSTQVQHVQTENTSTQHTGAQTISDFPTEESEKDEEEWEVERRKMQNAMDRMKSIIRKWKETGVVEHHVDVGA